MALTRLAHQLVKEHFQRASKNVAVDGTCGNGHDTEFLVRVGFKETIGFDIQSSAISNTRNRLEKAGLIKAEADNLELTNRKQNGHDPSNPRRNGFIENSVKLVHGGHERLSDHIKQDISCAMFNFGYLPNADKMITTTAATSVRALQSALEKLSSDGLLSLICYPGHEHGYIETRAIKQWLTGLDSQTVSIQQHQSQKPTDTTPILYLVKLKS